MTFHMIFFYDLSSQDRISSSTEIYANSNPPPGVNLNESGKLKLDFTLMLNNDDFDNDDNPFGKFIFHMYTNMKDVKDSTK